MYFEDFLNSRKQAQDAQRAPAAPAPAPVAEAKEEPEAEAEGSPAADEGVPVPTRANLRPVK
jgi:hypothetical protein